MTPPTRRTATVERRPAAAWLALAVGAIAAPAWAQPADDSKPGVTVANKTPWQYPVRVLADGKTVGTVSVDGRRTRLICLKQPASDRHVTVVLRSVWMPLGSCRLAYGGEAEIVRGEGQEATTRFVCR